MEVIYEDYVRNVRSNAQTAAVLAARLEKAAPADITSVERKALRQVLALADDVQGVQSDRDRLAPARLRPALVTFANDWSAIFESLGALARISADITKHGPTAQAILTSLFPEGVSFTTMSADRAWSEGKRRLDRIESEEGMKENITRLVGEHFIAAAKRSTALLADAIGTGKNVRPTASPTGLSEALTKFGRAVGAYGRLLIATVDEDDEASVARALAALAPIDLHRAAMGKGGGTGREEEPEEPSEPSEPVVTPVVTPVVSPAPTPGPSV